MNAAEAILASFLVLVVVSMGLVPLFVDWLDR